MVRSFRVYENEKTKFGAVVSCKRALPPRFPHCDARDRRIRHARPTRESARASRGIPPGAHAGVGFEKARLNRSLKTEKGALSLASAWRAPACGVARRWHPLMSDR